MVSSRLAEAKATESRDPPFPDSHIASVLHADLSVEARRARANGGGGWSRLRDRTEGALLTVGPPEIGGITLRKTAG